MELLFILFAICATWYLLKRHDRKSQPLNKLAIPLPGEPITNQKDACNTLAAALAKSRPKSSFNKDLVTEFRAEMQEHVDELRSSIELLKEELRNKTDYRGEIKEDLAVLEEEAGANAPPDEELEKARRHLGHLDREIEELKASLASTQAALAAFKRDRRQFVSDYLAHILQNKPTPNVARKNH